MKFLKGIFVIFMIVFLMGCVERKPYTEENYDGLVLNGFGCTFIVKHQYTEETNGWIWEGKHYYKILKLYYQNGQLIKRLTINPDYYNEYVFSSNTGEKYIITDASNCCSMGDFLTNDFRKTFFIEKIDTK